MTDYGSFDEHVAAVMDLLYAAANLTVYPEENGGATVVPPGTPTPYVLVQAVGERDDGRKLRHLSTRMLVRFYCQCVGANHLAAQRVSDLVADAILDYVPTINGRSCYPIRQDISRDPLSSDTTGATTVTITDVYRLESDPGRDGS